MPGEPVLLVPGFLAGDYTLSWMGGHLRHPGHRVYRSGIVANVGCLERGTAALELRLEHIAERRERNVAVIGHSLGGMMARGLAARRPDLVAGIVTMGSPMLAPRAAHDLLIAQVANGRSMTTSAGSGDAPTVAEVRSGAAHGRGLHVRRLCAADVGGVPTPAPRRLPFTAVNSRRDGITDWRACIDPAGQAREVRTSHIGMSLDPVVIDIVVEALAAMQAQPLLMRRTGWSVPEADVG